MAISYSGTHRKHTDGNRNAALKNEANADEHVFLGYGNRWTWLEAVIDVHLLVQMWLTVSQPPFFWDTFDAR